MRSRRYDREFKLSSIALHKGGKRAAQVCRDLGIPESTFSEWVKIYDQEGENGFPGSGNINPSNEGILRLKKELDETKQERDILKKALAIFSRQK